MRRLTALAAFGLSLTLAAPAWSAAHQDNSDAAWISALRCSDLVGRAGGTNGPNVSRFNGWLTGFMMGVSAAGEHNITKSVGVSDLGGAVLAYCDKHPNETVVEATLSAADFFLNLTPPATDEVQELTNPGSAH